MPPVPHEARNEHGGSADFWADYMTAHWSRVEENALARDGMSVNSGGGVEASMPPRGLRFMEDAQVAGSLVIAGERVDG